MIHDRILIKMSQKRGTKMTQLVKHPSLDFGSGHRFVGLSFPSGSALGMEPDEDFLPLLCPSPLLFLSEKKNPKRSLKT